jgi:hypothetical protein
MTIRKFVMKRRPTVRVVYLSASIYVWTEKAI